MSAFYSILAKQENPGRSVPIDPEDEKREAKEYEEREARDKAKREEKKEAQRRRSEQNWGKVRDKVRGVGKSGF